MLFQDVWVQKAPSQLLLKLFSKIGHKYNHSHHGVTPYWGDLRIWPEGGWKTRPHMFIIGSCNFSQGMGPLDSIFFFFSVKIKSGQVYSGLFFQSLNLNAFELEASVVREQIKRHLKTGRREIDFLLHLTVQNSQ